MTKEDDREIYDDDSDELNEMEEAELNCGKYGAGGCSLDGTEYCDWSCPFNKPAPRTRRPKKNQGELL